MAMPVDNGQEYIEVADDYGLPAKKPGACRGPA